MKRKSTRTNETTPTLVLLELNVKNLEGSEAIGCEKSLTVAQLY